MKKLKDKYRKLRIKWIMFKIYRKRNSIINDMCKNLMGKDHFKFFLKGVKKLIAQADKEIKKEQQIKPSKRGIELYPPDGLYKGDFDETESEMWIPCTCNDGCSNYCKGKCGCVACRMQYCDFGSER